MFVLGTFLTVSQARASFLLPRGCLAVRKPGVLSYLCPAGHVLCSVPGEVSKPAVMSLQILMAQASWGWVVFPRPLSPAAQLPPATTPLPLAPALCPCGLPTQTTLCDGGGGGGSGGE